MTGFWDVTWLILEIFVFVAYLMVMFQIIVDLFRDHQLGGFAKALWFIALIFLPILTAIIYLIVRGDGMAHRQLAAQKQARQEAESYIREVAGKSPAAQITEAKALLDGGVITREEFEKLKAKALS